VKTNNRMETTLLTLLMFSPVLSGVEQHD